VRVGWVRLKHAVDINARDLPDNTDPAYEFRYVDIGGVGRGELVEDPARIAFADAPSRARRLVRSGDTVVSTVRTYLRAVWPVRGDTGDLVVSTGFAVLSPRPELDAQYLGWLAQSDVVIDEIVARSVGMSYPAINGSEVGDIEVPLPPLARQRAISAYLGAEIQALDDVLNKKRRLVELLQERIDSSIMEHVGRSQIVGGDREVRALPMRRLLAKVERPPQPGAPTVTAFRDGQVTARSLRRSEGFTESWTDEARVQGVRRGDVVVHGLDGFAGAIGTSEADGVCSPVYQVCSVADGGDEDFYGRMLRLLATTGYLGNFATSTRERAVDFRNWDLFGRIPIPEVGPAEQRRIGDRIRGLAPIREAVARSGMLILERKQALITAAVTGQIEIPGVAA